MACLRFRRWAPAAALFLSAGCSLTEITVAEPEDVIVAEVQVVLTPAPDTDELTMAAWAILHRTYRPEGTPGISGAVVEVRADAERVVGLEEQDSLAHCIALDLIARDSLETDPSLDAACYRAEATPAPFAPGERLSVSITAPDGRVLTGVSRLPGAFSMIGLQQEDGRCRVRPDTHYRFRWTSARDSWAYVADARFQGLRRALGRRGIEAPDTLYLLGLAIGREDTTIVFPRQFGVFEAFNASDNELEILRELWKGLPEGVSAEVAIAAADRNWVNWERGGNFNPSGQIRIPSVFGDGTGVFATATSRRVLVKSAGVGDEPLCGPAEP
ncbi:MAG: hypothetical protein OXQ94_15260 [Gemmatimonadota bacterium]|nr:hypothetical protein [Gemmatimonadota bacterium]MDE2873035.1 hypothetical protein [Gemmatimonadota bacterium]